MSYNADLQQNNAELQDILAMVNALPEAGSGEVEINLQEKSVTPTKSAQEVTADSGYDGLLKVDVGAIPDEYIVPSGTKSITANGTHDVTANASVSVNVPVPDGYIIPSGTKSITENGTHNIKEYENVSVNVPVPDGYIVPSGTKTITANGEHDVTSFAKASVNVPIPDGYVKPSGTLNITENGSYDVTEKASVEVSVDTEPTLQSKTVTPTASDQNVTADSGYDGLSAVTVKGDANLVAGNIKSGVSIFGVSGTFDGSGGGGTSGGGFETCQVAIVQEWGMNDDPELLHLCVPYYNVLSDGSIEQYFVYFTSANDYEGRHSVTFTALKNVPISVVAKSNLSIDIRYTVSANGGSVASQGTGGVIPQGDIYTLTPTASTATFTFASP